MALPLPLEQFPQNEFSHGKRGKRDAREPGHRQPAGVGELDVEHAPRWRRVIGTRWSCDIDAPFSDRLVVRQVDPLHRYARVASQSELTWRVPVVSLGVRGDLPNGSQP